MVVSEGVTATMHLRGNHARVVEGIQVAISNNTANPVKYEVHNTSSRYRRT